MDYMEKEFVKNSNMIIIEELFFNYKNDENN